MDEARDTGERTTPDCPRCHGRMVTTVTTYNGTHSTSREVDCSCVERAICRHCGERIVHRLRATWVHLWGGLVACKSVTNAEPPPVTDGAPEAPHYTPSLDWGALPPLRPTSDSAKSEVPHADV